MDKQQTYNRLNDFYDIVRVARQATALRQPLEQVRKNKTVPNNIKTILPQAKKDLRVLDYQLALSFLVMQIGGTLKKTNHRSAYPLRNFSKEIISHERDTQYAHMANNAYPPLKYTLGLTHLIKNAKVQRASNTPIPRLNMLCDDFLLLKNRYRDNASLIGSQHTLKTAKPYALIAVSCIALSREIMRDIHETALPHTPNVKNYINHRNKLVHLKAKPNTVAKIGDLLENIEHETAIALDQYARENGFGFSL